MFVIVYPPQMWSYRTQGLTSRMHWNNWPLWPLSCLENWFTSINNKKKTQNSRKCVAFKTEDRIIWDVGSDQAEIQGSEEEVWKQLKKIEKPPVRRKTLKSEEITCTVYQEWNVFSCAFHWFLAHLVGHKKSVLCPQVFVVNIWTLVIKH
jgi:hypothetical protein